MKLELSHAERNALLDTAGRDRIASIAQSLLEQAKKAGFTHLQTIAVVDYIRGFWSPGRHSAGLSRKARIDLLCPHYITKRREVPR